MCRKLIFLVSFVLILGLAGNTFGALEWDNEAWVDPFWSTALNWDPNKVPGSGDEALIVLIDPSGCLIDSATTAVAKKVKVGHDAGPGDLRMTGGSLDISGGDFAVGDTDTGRFGMEDGTVTVSKGGASMKVGNEALGTFTMDDGTLTIDDTLYVADKAGSDGSVMTLSGGSVTLGDDLKVGDEGVGTLNMSDGSITIDDDLIIADNSGSGGSSLTLTGGTITLGDDLKVADKAGEDAAITIDGGTLTVGDALTIGKEAAGTFNMDDGTVTLGGKLMVGDGSGTDGSSMTMKAGSITTVGVFKVAKEVSASFDMQGGTIAVGPDVGEGKDKSMTIGDDVGGVGTMTMSDGYIDISGNLTLGDDGATGTLTMSGGTIDVGPGIGDDPTKNMNIGRDTGIGTVTMSGGTINVSDELNVGKTTMTDGIPDIGTEGTGTLTMTSGLIVVDANINIGLYGSTGNVYLSGDAVLEGDQLFIGAPASGGILDMCGDATLILGGDDLIEVCTFINSGLITVCGSVVTDEWPGWEMDFNLRNLGKTTVTVPEPATIALLGLGGLVLLRRRRR